jgi:hypothetical protein
MDADRFATFLRSLSSMDSGRRTLLTTLGAAIGLHRFFILEAVEAHNALTACKKKSGKQKKRCLKKARAHNATHTVAPPAEDRTPVDPCAGVTCGAVPHGMSACQNGVCVVTSCEGDHYDVDGDAANGCEATDETRGSAGGAELFCLLDLSSSANVSGTIVSDDRVHDPQPEGFDPATGSAPDSWGVSTACSGYLDLRFSTSGGSPDEACYLLRAWNSDGTQIEAQPLPGTTPSGQPYRARYGLATTSGVMFSLEKTCPTSVREKVTYTAAMEAHT